MGLIDSWNTKRLFGTWAKQGGAEKRAGTYKVLVPVRIVSNTDDVIVPSGVFAQGALNVTEGEPSLDVQVPATDDPDISPTGWAITVEITFSDGAAPERYVMPVPLAGGDINLRAVAYPVPPINPAEVYTRGVPGGLAVLDVDGDVIDADGNKVIGGEGGGGTGTTTVWYTGTTVPAGALGNVSDMYLRADGTVYKKTGTSTWSLQAGILLKGPQGDPGTPGDPGDPGAPGDPGEPGDDGNGIASITDNGNGTFTILETDGTSTTLTIPGGGGGDGSVEMADVIGLNAALDDKLDQADLDAFDATNDTALAARPQVVKVVTGSEARPAGSTSVVWYGGAAQPTNFNSANDVWLKDVVPSETMTQVEYDAITPDAGTVYFIAN